MANRIALARIVVGTGDDKEEAKEILPGTEFNPAEFNMSEEDVKRYDETGVTREMQAQPKASNERVQREREDLTPREESELGLVTEGRSPVQKDGERAEDAANRSNSNTTTTVDRSTDRTRTRRDHDL